MFWAILTSAVVSATVAAIVAYKKGYKDGRTKSYWSSIDLC